MYPALDAKVKNVTLAYSVEHEDEERLFDQLTFLLVAALRQDGKERYATLRQLECKIEEVHTTLRKHLSKEEEQLLPLLLQHFTFAEQVRPCTLSTEPSADLFAAGSQALVLLCRQNWLHSFCVAFRSPLLRWCWLG